MTLIPKTYRLLHLAWPVAVLALASLAPTPARADFFDGLRQTFTTGIPHFFQDDIPRRLWRAADERHQDLVPFVR